jgi:hypothetical protein
MSYQQQDVESLIKEACERHCLPDGTVDIEAATADAAAVLGGMPADRQIHLFIKHVLKKMEEPGETEATGTVNLPGFKPTWLYEPERSCVIGGTETLWRDMTVAQHAAVAKRNWELVEAAHHATWAAFQVEKNKRDLSTLTWDECVRDTGVLTPFSEEEMARRRAAFEEADDQ